jgi:hypothetical protein
MRKSVQGSDAITETPYDHMRMRQHNEQRQKTAVFHSPSHAKPSYLHSTSRHQLLLHQGPKILPSPPHTTDFCACVRITFRPAPPSTQRLQTALNRSHCLHKHLFLKVHVLYCQMPIGSASQHNAHTAKLPHTSTHRPAQPRRVGCAFRHTHQAPSAQHSSDPRIILCYPISLGVMCLLPVPRCEAHGHPCKPL